MHWICGCLVTLHVQISGCDVGFLHPRVMSDVAILSCAYVLEGISDEVSELTVTALNWECGLELLVVKASIQCCQACVFMDLIYGDFPVVCSGTECLRSLVTYFF